MWSRSAHTSSDGAHTCTCDADELHAPRRRRRRARAQRRRPRIRARCCLPLALPSGWSWPHPSPRPCTPARAWLRVRILTLASTRCAATSEPWHDGLPLVVTASHRCATMTHAQAARDSASMRELSQARCVMIAPLGACSCICTTRSQLLQISCAPHSCIRSNVTVSRAALDCWCACSGNVRGRTDPPPAPWETREVCAANLAG